MKNTPVIIFDGPDNVGKGTQIALLRKFFTKTPFAISNLDKPVGETLEEKREYGINAVTSQLSTLLLGASNGIPQIADRAHYSEYAYSMLRIPHAKQDLIAREEQHKALIPHTLGIIFIDEVEAISERDDGKSNYQADDLVMITSIIKRFVDYADSSLFNTHVININGKDITTVHQEVVSLVLKTFPELR